MSTTMTRDEAIEMVELGASILACYAEDHLRDKLLQALSILAPEPRTEPPTVDEVGDEEWCIAFSKHAKAWTGWTGRNIRSMWGKTWIAWLPYNALPMPKGGE